jgi:chromosomal replication initiation ATPase DnaA
MNEKLFLNGGDYIYHNGYIYKKHEVFNVDIDLIINTCCNYFGCTRENVFSKDRYKTIGFIPARHMAMYILRRYSYLSFSHIAKIFNKKDHSTVFYAVKKVDTEVGMYEDTKNALFTILKNISNEQTDKGGGNPILQRQGN